MSLLREMKLTSRDRIFLSRRKCWFDWSFIMSRDIVWMFTTIFSAYDKFSWHARMSLRTSQAWSIAF